MMKVKQLFSSIAAAVVLASASPAGAALVTYDLNLRIDGGTNLTSIPSFGTVAVRDVILTDWLLVTVDLVNTPAARDHKVQSMSMNHVFADNSGWWTPLSDFGVRGSLNGTMAGGYAGRFDIRIPDPPPGNLGEEPVGFLLARSGVDLSPSHLNVLDTLGNLFLAVHIGNCGGAPCQPGVPGENSIWVGAGPGRGTVPEPGSLVLAGVALAGLAFIHRRRQRSA